MTKVMIVYESKYGNTKKVAETIAEGMKVSEIEPVFQNPKEVDLKTLGEVDAILIGSPNHMGNATRGIRKFIDSLGKLDLKGKLITVFDTCFEKDFEKAVKKMEKRIGEKVPGVNVFPGLSVRVEGTKGPITGGELPRCKEFGEKVAQQVTNTN